MPGAHRLSRSTVAGDDPLGGGPIPDGVLSALRRRSGSGQPLPRDVREPVGAELGHDLSAVRVHADAEADRIARSVQSVAFSYGTDVYFTAGTYRPGDSGGQRLLAHELAHVTQVGTAGQAGTVGRADDPAEAAADRTADRVVGALRRRAAEPFEQPATGPDTTPGGTARLRRQYDRTLRRTITYNKFAKQIYAQNRAGLLGRLTDEFPGIDPELIEAKIIGVEEAKAPWSPYDTYLGIKRWLLENYAPEPAVFSGGSHINQEEARHYFVSNFKTFAEVILDNSKVFKFTNITDDDMHAEDNFMATVDKYIVEKKWHKDFSENHTILMRINNSPCTRCAERLYNWHFRDIFVDFDIQFANIYEKGSKFDKATTRLRSGGITMSLYNVTANLQSLLSKTDVDIRKKKDAREAFDFAAWLKQNSASTPSTDVEMSGQ